MTRSARAPNGWLISQPCAHAPAPHAATSELALGLLDCSRQAIRKGRRGRSLCSARRRRAHDRVGDDPIVGANGRPAPTPCAFVGSERRLRAPAARRLGRPEGRALWPGRSRSAGGSGSVAVRVGHARASSRAAASRSTIRALASATESESPGFRPMKGVLVTSIKAAGTETPRRQPIAPPPESVEMPQSPDSAARDSLPQDAR